VLREPVAVCALVLLVCSLLGRTLNKLADHFVFWVCFDPDEKGSIFLRNVGSTFIYNVFFSSPGILNLFTKVMRGLLSCLCDA
jgi:hypothetical protein